MSNPFVCELPYSLGLLLQRGQIGLDSSRVNTSAARARKPVESAMRVFGWKTVVLVEAEISLPREDLRIIYDFREKPHKGDTILIRVELAPNADDHRSRIDVSHPLVERALNLDPPVGSNNALNFQIGAHV